MSAQPKIQAIHPESYLIILHEFRVDKRWWARCVCLACNNEKSIRKDSLLGFGGKVRSCGCITKELLSESHSVKSSMGSVDKPEYRNWEAMNTRCNDLNNPDYGGRGITVCARWRDSFDSFLEDMGNKPGPEYSIERIDNSKGYEPDNCRWATREEQSNNTRRNTLVEYNGRTQTLAQWGKELGIKYGTLMYRHRAGKTGSELLKVTQKD